MPSQRDDIDLLKNAAKSVGGVKALARRVRISAELMRLYLEGRQPIPKDVVFKAIDIVLDGPLAKQPRSPFKRPRTRAKKE